MMEPFLIENELSQQSKMDLKVDPLNPAELYYQKTLFEETLVRELLAEVKFLWDVMAERSSAKKDFKEKLSEIITTVLSKGLTIISVATGPAAPFVALSGSLVEVGSIGVSKWFEVHKEKKITTLGNLFYAEDKYQLELVFRQFAKAASLRYEWLIAIALSRRPDEGVIPFACTGARRVMEYLCRLAKGLASQAENEDEFKQLPLNVDILLEALIQGRSGKWIDGFKNNRIKGRSIWQVQKMSAEGAYSRTAMRLLLPGQFSSWKKKWEIRYTKEAKHKQQGYEKHYDWGRTELLEEKKPAEGPKYGYMLVSEKTSQAYGYNETLSIAPDKNEYFNHIPTVKMANLDDIEGYNELIETSIQNKKSYPTFLEFIKNKYNKQRIDQVWIQNVEIPDLKGGDYTDIDFSGCSFEGADLENVMFNRANLTFANFKETTCKNVSFDQANLSYSNFENATFSDKVSYIGAIWIGTKLQGLKKGETELLKEIESIKERHTKQIDEIHRNHFKLQEKVNAMEQKIASMQQTMNEHLEKVADNNKQLQVEVFKLQELIDEVSQVQLNHSRFQVHCEARLFSLETAIVDTQRAFQTQKHPGQFESQPDELKALKQQIEKNTQSKTYFEKLMADLQKQLSEEKDLNQGKLNELAQSFSQQLSDLQTKLSEEIYGIKNRLDNVEADLEEVKDALGETTRQTLIVHAFEGNILEEGARAEFGSAQANILKIKGNQALTEKEQQLIEFMAKKASKANMRVFAFQRNKLGKNSFMKTGDAEANAVLVDKAEKTINESKNPVYPSKTAQGLPESEPASSDSSSFKLPTKFPASLLIREQAEKVAKMAKRIYPDENHQDYKNLLSFLARFESESFLVDDLIQYSKELDKLETTYYAKLLREDKPAILEPNTSKAVSSKSEPKFNTPSLKAEVEEEKPTDNLSQTSSTQLKQKSSFPFFNSGNASNANSSLLAISVTALQNFPSLNQVQSFEANDDDGFPKVKVIFATMEIAQQFSQELFKQNIKLKNGSPRKPMELPDKKGYVYVSEAEFNQIIKENDHAYEQLMEAQLKQQLN